MTAGEVVDSREIETDAGRFVCTLRFIDWVIPDHRDTQSRIVPRYTLTVERRRTDTQRRPSPDEELHPRARFEAWGSVHEGEEQELHGTVRRYLPTVARDAMSFYDYGGDELPDRVTLASLEAPDGDYADVLDTMADEGAIPGPSEAIRIFRAVVDSARKFKRLGLDRDGLAELHQRADSIPPETEAS